MKHPLRQHIILVFLFSFLLKAFPAENYSLSSQTDSIPNKILYQPLQFKVGLVTGWKTPYGTGLDFSFVINELFDANLGCGISISGTKVGFGTRFFPMRQKSFSPMIGAYFLHSAGQNNITVSFNYDSAIYRIKPDNALLINGGFRLRFGKGHYIIAGLGYSIPFKDEEAVFISGSTSDAVKSLANTLTIGGVSISCGILIKLSPGKFRVQ